MAEVRNGSNVTERIFVWGTQYIDEPIAMAVNTAVDDASVPNRCLDANDAVYTYHQDHNYDLIALTAPAGDPNDPACVVERYDYDPYGQVRVLRGQDPDAPVMAEVYHSIRASVGGTLKLCPTRLPGRQPDRLHRAVGSWIAAA